MVSVVHRRKKGDSRTRETTVSVIHQTLRSLTVVSKWWLLLVFMQILTVYFQFESLKLLEYLHCSIEKLCNSWKMFHVRPWESSSSSSIDDDDTSSEETHWEMAGKQQRGRDERAYGWMEEDDRPTWGGAARVRVFLPTNDDWSQCSHASSTTITSREWDCRFRTERPNTHTHSITYSLFVCSRLTNLFVGVHFWNDFG